MGKTAIVAGVSLLLFCPALMSQSSQPATSGQNPPAAQPTPEPDRPARRHRPTLPLQDALKTAEAYIVNEHIDISSYWLSDAHFILYGSPETPDKDKIRCWHFLWMNDSGSIGDYVEILVDMKGRAWRVPSM